MSKEPGKENLDSRLVDLMDRAKRENGIFVQNLAADDVVEVKTSRSVYKFRVISPEKKSVELLESPEAEELPRQTYLNGSSLTGTGTMIKIGWISVGYRALLGNRLLSPTEEVSINGFKILPRPNRVVYA